VGEVDYQKIVNREAMRLKMSHDEGVKLKGERNMEILVFLHFPPVFGDFMCRELIDVLREYEIKRCFFGHIHGNYYMNRRTEFEGIDLIMIASDYLNFAPMPVFPEN
jgi:predicted phosphohydrolase